MGGELLGVSGWGGMLGGKGMVDGGSPADEFGLSSALVGPFPILPVPLLSLYFPYPLDQLSLTLPVPLISHNNDTRAPMA